MGLADGLAEGIGMFIPGICVCGDADGAGAAEGICMPGMSFIFAGVGDGNGLGEAAGVGEGIGILCPVC